MDHRPIVRTRPSWGTWGAAAAVAAAYAITARIGEALAFPSAPVSALWAPNALLMAALLITPSRTWWVYLALIIPAHVAVQTFVGDSAVQIALQYGANCGTALVGAWTFRVVSAAVRIDRMRAAVAFILLCGAFAPVLSSALMAAAFEVFHVGGEFWLTAGARALTNAFAVLTLVPLVMEIAAWVRHPGGGVRVPRALECGLLLASLTTLAVLAYTNPMLLKADFWPLIYALFVILLWAAMRFGVSGVCVSALTLGVLSTCGVLNQAEPFVTGSPVQNAVWLLLFLVVTCAALLLLAVALEERKLLEQASAASEARFRTIFARNVIPTVIWQSNGRISEANESFCALTGYERADLSSGQVNAGSLFAAASGADLHGPVPSNPAEFLASDTAERVLLGRDGRRIPVLVGGCRFPPPSPEGTTYFFDLSSMRRAEAERVQAERQSQEQRQQLAVLGRAAVLGELSGAFAHELAQPLTSILGNAEAALQICAGGSPELEEILRDIIKDDVRAAEVIQRLRSMLARGVIERQVVDLNQVVRDVLTLAHSDLITRNVAVSLQLGLPAAPVLADAVQLQQVLLNLIMNACEAMSEKAPGERRLTIATQSIDGGLAIQCDVSDRGSGIAPDDLEHLFMPFFTTKKRGLGLGLAICRSIIEAHGGRLWAENAPECGAVFRFIVGTGV